MPKWKSGYKVSPYDSLTSTSNLSDSSLVTYEIVSSSSVDASITAIWNLGPSPQQVTGYDLVYSLRETPYWDLEYSTDGSAWTSIFVTSQALIPCAENTHTRNATGLTITARFWRFSLKDAIGGCGLVQAKIYEFRLTKSGGGLPTEFWDTPGETLVLTGSGDSLGQVLLTWTG